MTSFRLFESFNGVRARVGTKQVLQSKSFKICIPPRVISADLITMTVFCSTDPCRDPVSVFVVVLFASALYLTHSGCRHD